MQAKPVNTPLPFETIKKLVETEQWVKIFNKRTRVMLGLGEKNSEINARTQQYLQEEVMPDVYKTIDEFLVKNSLSLIGYWDFCKYGATVVDKEQYLAFVANDRREAPKANWEKFDELGEELKKLGNVQIVGSKNPETNDPTWTIKSEISPELVKDRAELLAIVEKVKAKFKEFDADNAKLQALKDEAPEEADEVEAEPQPESENLTPDEPKPADEEKIPEPQQETPVKPEKEENGTQETKEDKDDTQKSQDQVEPEWKPEPEEAPGKETKE